MKRKDNGGDQHDPGEQRRHSQDIKASESQTTICEPFRTKWISHDFPRSSMGEKIGDKNVQRVAGNEAFAASSKFSTRPS
jgi:hypothetical protein